MVFRRCEFLNCASSASGPSTKTFHKVLLKNSSRDLEKWKVVCGVTKFSKESVICGDHFQDEDFINPLCKTQGLRPTAVPCSNRDITRQIAPVETINSMDVDIQLNGSDRTSEAEMVLDHSMDVVGEVVIDGTTDTTPHIPLTTNRLRENQREVPELHDHDYCFDPIRYMLMADRLVELEAENLKLKRELRKNKQSTCKKNSVIYKLRLEFKKIKEKSTALPTNPLQDPILSELQKNKNRKCRGARYSDAMKNMALVLQYCSTKAYRQMRQFMALPGLSTVRKWLGRIIIREGFSTTVFQLLKLKASTLDDDEKLVTLFLDEMAISERVTYFYQAKPDYFSGFPTKLPGQDTTNTKVRAKSALTLMIKSIRSGFKQAIGYFFCNGLTAVQQKAIVDKALDLIVDAGFIPKVITCDQNSVNRNMFSKEYGATVEAPYFDIRVDQGTNRVYCMFDAPHLIKSCRNNLLKHNAVWDGQLCSFDDIVALYWEDVKHVPRIVPGLSYEHIRLSQFSEMNVGLAVQALSHSVVAGLKDYVRTGKLSERALNTARFCEEFDMLFDIANSSSLKEKKELKRPLKTDSPHWSFLDAVSKKLRKLYFVDKACLDLANQHKFMPLIKNSKTPFFIDGWLSYISALKLLWEELETQYDFRFLRTRNLSQDCLEHFFSVIRWKNGNNTHPDCSQFSSAYKAVVVNQLLVPKKVGNVQADISRYIVANDELRQLNVVQKQHSRNDGDKHVETLQDLEDDSFDENRLSSIHWTTGWACSKLSHPECIGRITSGSENIPEGQTALAGYKKYNDNVKIQTPGDKIFTYFKGVCKVFEQNFEILLETDTVGVKEELLDLIQVLFKYPTVSTDDNTAEETQEVDAQLVMDILCIPCALKITEKYLNMLICCKLSKMNDGFRASIDLKRKNRRNDKAKKLNISRLSQLMVDTPTIQLEPKKKCFRKQEDH